MKNRKERRLVQAEQFLNHTILVLLETVGIVRNIIQHPNGDPMATIEEKDGGISDDENIAHNEDDNHQAPRNKDDSQELLSDPPLVESTSTSDI